MWKRKIVFRLHYTNKVNNKRLLLQEIKLKCIFLISFSHTDVSKNMAEKNPEALSQAAPDRVFYV